MKHGAGSRRNLSADQHEALERIGRSFCKRHIDAAAATELRDLVRAGHDGEALSRLWAYRRGRKAA